ncbi:restriction endonuclease subunit S [Agrobacterium sp. FDAARGOS_525]|uniref:restriction endonuclease subunit S n=1 Tax=Agrobacterium sp. FDAARGOS_525 TaxID=2420311 RepID=UPI000F68ABD1|nr:restriction endonuclease subunit S [Agrobacterium sp. FDAARGOS_525]RSC37647.1 restriction endonuclease subunit S [Agrobacterium sp. FDAARGOS_525]
MPTKLGEICRLVGGFAFKSGDFGTEGVPVIKISDVTGGGTVNYDGLQRVPQLVAHQTKKFSPAPRDTLISMTGANVGKTARTGYGDPEARINQRVGRFVPITELHFSKDYIHYLVSRPEAYLYFANAAYGSAQPNISGALIESLPIPDIPAAIANKIGELLGCLDDKIELNRRMNETLEAMAQAIFRDWFVDFGPTRRKVEGASDPVEIMGGLVTDAECAQKLADLFPARFGDNGLPEGWGAGRLEDVLELAYGKSLPKGDRRDGPYPVYGSGGIGGFHDAALVKGPSVVVGRKGTVGSLYWEDRDFYPIDTVFYVKSEKPMTYCYYLLQTLGLDGMNTDAAVPGLNRSNAYRLDVAMASAAIVREFGHMAGLLRQRITSNEIESRTLAATRDLLLPKLMSGEIRLRDVEEQLEAAQ